MSLGYGPALAQRSRSLVKFRARTDCEVGRDVDSEAVALRPRKDVEMDVPNVLTSRLAVCKKEVDALALQAGHPEGMSCRLSDPEHLRTVIRIEIRQLCGVGLRNDEHMSGLYRLNVHDRDCASVLVNDTHLAFMRCESTEQTITTAAAHRAMLLRCLLDRPVRPVWAERPTLTGARYYPYSVVTRRTLACASVRECPLTSRRAGSPPMKVAGTRLALGLGVRVSATQRSHRG